MCLVNIGWTSELCLFSDNFRENYILLEQKYMQFFRLLWIIVVLFIVVHGFNAVEWSVEEELSLSGDFALKNKDRGNKIGPNTENL
jgi:hypothetical protein